MAIIKELIKAAKPPNKLRPEPEPSLAEKGIDWIKRFKNFAAYEEYVVNKWKKRSGLPENLQDTLGIKTADWKLKAEYKSEMTEAGLLMLAAVIFGVANQAVDLNVILQIATGASGIAGLVTGVTSTADFMLMMKKHSR